ncbi:MAG: Wzz/FepE/Etk N-terminal domain-containing protein [Phycisphaerae bacterium]
MRERENQFHEDEIDLYRYWMIIRKRWKLIFVLFLVSVASSVAVSFYLPKIYRVTATINMGRIEVGDRTVPVINFADIQQIVSSESLLKKILSSLPVDASKKTSDLAFRISVENNTNSENVLLKLDTSDPERGKKVLTRIISEIQEKYNHRAENYRQLKDAEINKLKETINKIQFQDDKIDLSIQRRTQEIEKKEKTAQIDINLLNNEKDNITNQIKYLKEQNKSIEVSRDKLLQILPNMEQNTRQLLKEKNELAKSINKEGIMTSILYASNLQQSINFLTLDYERLKEYEVEINKNKAQAEKLSTQLKNQDEKLKNLLLIRDSDIKSIRRTLQELKGQKEKEIQSEIGKVNTDIAGLQARKNMIEDIEIFSPPDYFATPVKSNNKLMVIGAGLISIFVGIFLAFFLEWQKDNESRMARTNKETLKNEQVI